MRAGSGCARCVCSLLPRPALLGPRLAGARPPPSSAPRLRPRPVSSAREAGPGAGRGLGRLALYVNSGGSAPPARRAGGEQEGDGRPAARGPARGTGAAGDGRRGTPRPRAGPGPRLQVSPPGFTRSSGARAVRGGAAREDPSPLGFPGWVREGSTQVCLARPDLRRLARPGERHL